MKFFTKIEDFINKILLKLIAAFWALVHKIIPQKFFDFIEKTKQKIINFKIFLIEKKSQLIAAIKGKVLQLKEKIFVVIFKLKSLPYKDLLIEKINKVKEEFQILKNADHKSFVIKCLNYIILPFKKTLEFLKGLDPNKVGIGVLLSMIMLLSVVTVFDQATDIYQKENPRKPASVEEVEFNRPEYYKKDDRTYTLIEVKMPLYIESIHDIRTITLDITITTSTRFAKKYLEFNGEKVRDHLVMNVEPILSSFPLNDPEGKRVINAKVRDELNLFLIGENVEGEVDEVRLTYILGH